MPIVIDLTTLAPAEGFIVQGDAAGDQAGSSVSSAGDINGDGIDDFIVGAPRGAGLTGAAYVIFGKTGATRADIDLTTLSASDGFIIEGDSPDDRLGISVSSAGDINGDGIDDFVVGAHRGDDGGLDAGEAYVIFGKAGATRANIDLTSLTANDGFIIQGNAAGDNAGWSVSSAGDINGDGIDDLIIGAPRGDNGGADSGEAYVIFGKVGATRANIDLTSLAANDGFIIQGKSADDRAGWSVSSAGDINGDGIDDLIVSAHLGDIAGANAGEAYVIFGKVGATRANIELNSLAASDGFVILGDAAGDQAGLSVSSAGDINGDGIDDLILSAPYGGNGGASAGEAYVIFGKAGSTRANIDLTSLSAGDGFIIEGDAVGDYSGYSVSAAGDVDGDGIDDLIVGAWGVDGGGSYAGAAYVIFGKTGATRANIDLTTLSTRDGFIIQGDAAGDYAGISVSDAGDINGDGFADVLVGANLGDNGGDNAGEAYVIYGRAALTSPAGTLNGTTLADILNGTTSADQINGLDSNDTLWGGGGDDTLDGGGGDDTIDGGEGNDLLDGGTGSDTLIGGNGTDTLRVSASVSPISISGLEAIELVGGATLTLSAAQFNTGFYNAIAQIGVAAVSGNGTLAFTIDANPIGAALSLTGLTFAGGSSVSVTIAGSSGIDVVKGAVAVANTITGDDGADQIRGGNQADTISGGIGNDKLFGWGGTDVLTGGAGSDQFRYFFATDSGTGGAADRITDFEIGIDRFNFTLIDTNPGLAGVQGFAFLGTGAFTAAGTGQIRYQNSGSDLIVQADVNGDGAADMDVILQNLAGQVLTASDFMLGTPPALEPLSGKGIGGGVDVLPGLASAKGGGEVQALESYAIAQFQPEAYLHDPRFLVWGFVNEPWLI